LLMPATDRLRSALAGRYSIERELGLSRFTGTSVGFWTTLASAFCSGSGRTPSAARA